jgi:hypothetical protein
VRGRVSPEPPSPHARTDVVHGREARHRREEEPAAPVAPERAGEERGERIAQRRREREVPAVLPRDDGVAPEVADVDASVRLRGLEERPADVRVEEPAVHGVRVAGGVRVAVVGAVGTGPPDG